MKYWSTFFAFAFAASLAGCGGGSQAAFAGSGGSGPLPCPAIAIQSPTLAYPAPGATNVPFNAGVLVLYSYSNPVIIPIDVQIAVSAATPIDLGLMKAAPSVIPTPTAAPPSPPAANIGSVVMPSLLRTTTYIVTVQSPSGSCPLVGTATLGTFTTN